MEPQNTDDKALEEASESSRFFSFSGDCNRGASDSEVEAPENNECVGTTRNAGNNSVNVGCAVKNCSVIDGINGENMDGVNAPKSLGDDSMRKVQVSGDNISLVVDFSGSLGRFSRNKHSEAQGSSPMVNLDKENEAGDQTHNFSVGDIIWVLSKSQNWWPGKITDVRADQKEYLMVSYFGQSRVAWCSSSQLKPFLEKFDKMLKQGKARSFFGAVEKALADFGESLRLEMTCSCISKENRKFRAFGEFSLDKLKPEEFLTKAKNLAKVVSMPGMLELTVMQSRVSAFYSSIGHEQIPLDQLYENSEEQCLGLTKEKSRNLIQEGSNSRKRMRVKDSEILVGVDEGKDLGDIPKMETNVSNLGVGDCGSGRKIQKAFASRERKKSKYFSYPFVNSNDAEYKKGPESTDQFVGSPSNFIGSGAKRFQKEWFKKFISNESNMFAKANLVNVSPADLLSKLQFVAVDCQYPKQSVNFHLNEWFFSKFRISLYHDESIYEIHCKNTIDEKDLTFAEYSSTDSEQKTSKRKKNSRKSKMKSLSGLSDMDADCARNSLCVEDSLRQIHPQTSGEKSALADTPNEPATKLPDLNGGGAMLNFIESDRSENPKFFSLPDLSGHGGTSRSMMLNFEVPGPCLANSVPNRGLTCDQLDSSGNNFTLDTILIQEKRKQRRKGKEDAQKTTLASGIPDLNGSATEIIFPAAQDKPKQRRRRRKKEKMINRETRGGTTTLFLNFSPEASMPSKDDLTSTFSGFGPLSASETQLLKEPGGAQVAFMSSADALEAVRSLEKNNPFSETLISFRLEPKLATVNVNLAPRMPVKSDEVGASCGKHKEISRPGDAPMSVDYIRQNLVMMTSMLEKGGGSLSQEMRVKLEGEIKGLLEKVSSMPSSSAS